MKHIIWKAYWNYEKEEKWLNEMSAKGMALTDYSWCRYVFAETPANEYIYRIELLEHMPRHPESAAYIRFMEENGIEFVTSYMRWIYLRKKSSEGAFNIYSDMESRIRHFQRISMLWTIMMWVELIAGVLNLSIAITNICDDGSLGNFTSGNFVMGIFLLMISFLFWRLGVPVRKNIRKLRREQAIRE